ncbi:MAG: type IV pilus twitching motility protein PilT [Dehalococcoidales bacterium]
MQEEQIAELLKLTVDKKASDLHLRIPSPPVLRIDGALVIQEDLPPVTAQDIEMVFQYITTPEQRNTFFNELELDFAYSIHGLARFRVSVMKQRNTISIAFRTVPFEVMTIDGLGLPQICKELVLKPRGLILVTGPTGSGKSTTMAAMVDYLNDHESRNVITIEEPIEYLHRNKKCLIAQRDLGDDTRSFSSALVHALRHDPDVIVVGEMRDLETISTAIRAAETGHLVLGTLHTTDAPQTVDRIIDIFPHGQQQQIRLQLSQVMEGILSQTLLPRIGGGRVGAFEIMTTTSAVRNLIREQKTFELHSIMQLNAKDGMQTLDQALANLLKQGIITKDDALMKSSSPERLNRLLQFPQSRAAV